MADVRRVPKTKARTAKPRKPKAIAVLSEEDRNEYALRHTILLQRNMEYQAIAAMQDAFRDALVVKYGLPDRFDLKLDTGECFPRQDEDEANAENGRV